MSFGKADSAALQRLVEESGVAFRQNKRSYIFTCPRCSKKDKLMMFKADGRFVCWVCAETSGFKGRPEIALSELLGVGLKTLRDKLYGEGAFSIDVNYFDVSLIDLYGDEPVPDEIVKQVRGKAWPLDFFEISDPRAIRGLEYLQGRGIDLKTAQAYRLRYCPVQKRVIFPCYVGNKLLGWQARYILPHEWEDEETGLTKKIPKILTTGERDHFLMFQDRLVGSEHAIICEGPVDAMKCHLLGGNVATMGKVVSDAQISIIRGSGVRKIYLGLDLDAGSESMKLLSAFTDYYDIEARQMFEIYKLNPLPGYEDLGAMPIEAMPEAFASAERLTPGRLFLGFS